MKIPDAYFDGGFGRRGPTVAPIPQFDNSGAEAIAQAGRNVSNTLMQIARDDQQRQEILQEKVNRDRERILREQEQEQKHLEKEKQKSEAMTALFAHENTLNDIVQEIRKDPNIPTEKYTEVFREQAQQTKSNFLKSVPEEYQYAFAPTFDQHIYHATGKMNEVIQAETRDKAKANIQTMIEQLERSPKSRAEKMTLLSEVPDETVRAAGIGADDWAKTKQTFNERQAETELASRLERENPKTIMEELNAKGADGAPTKYTELDPKTREVYYHTAKNRWEALKREEEQARKERQRERNELARDAYDEYKDAKENLKPLTPKEEARLLKQIKGTRYEEKAVKIARSTSGIEYLTEKIKKDPLRFGAAQMGLNVPPLDVNNMQAWPQQLEQRAKVATAIKLKHGLPYLPILTGPEAKNVGDYLKEQAPQGLVSTITQFKSALGDKTVKRMAQQFAADSPELGMVVGLVAGDRPDAAYHVATGTKLLKEKAAVLDKQTGQALQSRFESNLGDAVNHLPQMRGQFLDAFKAAYVSMAGQKGLLSDGLDKKTADAAFKSVIGETAKINGKRVVLPPGMTEGTFKDFFKSLSSDQVKQSGNVYGFKTPEEAAAAIRDDAKLYEVGDGRYRFAIGGRYLMTGDGKRPFEMSIGAHY